MAMSRRTPSQPDHSGQIPVQLPGDARPDVIYDALPDMLIVFFHGRQSPHFVDYVSGNYALLRDPNDERIVGLQVEDFLSAEGKRHPELLPALDTAELLGLSRQEADAITASAGASRSHVRAVPTSAHSVQSLLDAIGGILERSDSTH